MNFHSRESLTTTRRPELAVTVSNEAYARPAGAVAAPRRPSCRPTTPALRANRMHGPPLEHPSCNPPSQASDNLTVGTQDANGNAGQLGRVIPVRGAARRPRDARLTRRTSVFEFRLSDVRTAGTLSDYSGELQSRATIRITDRRSRPGANETGTVEDLVLPATIPCAVTPDANTGAVCNVTTSLDAITPGLVREGARAIWALGPVEVMDGGSDGDVDTAPNQIFARQGIFIP